MWSSIFGTTDDVRRPRTGDACILAKNQRHSSFVCCAAGRRTKAAAIDSWRDTSHPALRFASSPFSPHEECREKGHIGKRADHFKSIHLLLGVAQPGQTGTKKRQTHPPAVRANLDDPPIHIRPAIPASAGAKKGARISVLRKSVSAADFVENEMP